MKTIELIDEELWMIEVPDNDEKVKYILSDQVYNKLELISINAYSSIDYLFFEGTKLNAPNLKFLVISGEGSKSCFQLLYNIVLSSDLIEEIYFYYTRITQIPEFVFKTKALLRVTFRGENITEIPDEIFELVALQQLSFEYSDIRIIPEKIKELVNLVGFNLWGSRIDYLSPELFLLPKIQNINFAYSSYQPTNEVLDALKIFQKKESNYFSKWSKY